MSSFSLTAKQLQAKEMLGSDARHLLLYGGSRSGKTALIIMAMIMRALKAPRSRHAIFRYRFNAVVSSVIYDTFPKVMTMMYPGVTWNLNKQHWFIEFANNSEIWFAGLDDKERTEKVLGSEYASLFLNECSQIPWSSRNLAVTRLAQRVVQSVDGVTPTDLALRVYYDCNPPDRNHWTYRYFILKQDPDTRIPLPDPGVCAAMQMNPVDNADNLPTEYLDSLRSLSSRMQTRFLLGEFRDANPNALFKAEDIDKWRVVSQQLPDMQRVVVAVDPSGAGDKENTEHDAIGIVVAGLGTDGNAYLLEDLTLTAGPATWARVATDAYDRHSADLIVAEVNFGGAMVKEVIMSARRNTPFQTVTASRGKVVRAEPIASLVEQGKVRIVGYQGELEDELSGFTTAGYVGDRSPNRADAFVWAMSTLFPGVVRGEMKNTRPYVAPQSWLCA